MAASDFSARRWWPVGIAVALAATACQALVTFTVDGPDASASPDDAGTEADVEEIVDPCAPELPTRRDGGARPDEPPSLSPLVFAAYVWGFEANGRPELCPEPGINLDGVYTQGSDCKNTSCLASPAAGGVLTRACDLDGGIDNASQPAFAKLRAVPGVGPALDALSLDELLNRGATNILVELAEYNGLPDDDNVRVSMFSSSGVFGQEIVAASHADLAVYPEVWDGGQSFRWMFDDNSVGGTRTAIIPKYLAEGFVRGGVLVVPNMPTGFAAPGFLAGGPNVMHNTRFSARVVKDGDRFKLTHARLIGSFDSSALLAVVGRIRIRNQKQACDPELATDYDLLRRVACSALDMPPESAGTYAPGEVCNEASFGFGMAMTQQEYATYISDAGRLEYAIGPGFGSYGIPVCPDPDAGTEWCDDCSWSEGARRCDASTRPYPVRPFDAAPE